MNIEEIENRLREFRKDWVIANESQREIIKRQARALIIAKEEMLKKNPLQIKF